MRDHPLRIAVVAPPFYSIPPQGYGGIEAVVALLVEGLVDRGHDVTLLAAGEPGTRARTIATFEEPQWQRLGRPEPELLHAARAAGHLEEIAPDVIHDHTAIGPVLARDGSVPRIVTSHGPANGEWGDYLAAGGDRLLLVAISEAQVRLAPHLPWRRVVHNALDVDPVPFRAEKEDYVVWLGRFSPDKGAHLAIDVAEGAGQRIVLAGKCSEPDEQAYFDEFVRPRLGKDAEYVEEVGGGQKYDLLGRARAFVFPLQWEEPFGMVLVEAMACGTPVLSLARGAVPEVVVDGVTGFVRDEADQLVDALRELDRIDPAACRAHVERNFGPEQMVEAYERLYYDCVEAARGDRTLDLITARMPSDRHPDGGGVSAFPRASE